MGAIVAALVGGLVVGGMLQQVQSRRERAVRLEHDRQEDERMREALSLDMMRVAYSFLSQLQEVERRRKYGQEKPRWFQTAEKSSLAPMDDLYHKFRTDARVVEATLHARGDDTDGARWYWHGAVDTLVARYYELAQPRTRFLDIVRHHGQHASDLSIPEKARVRLLNEDQLKDQRARERGLIELLEEAFAEVVGRRSGRAVYAHPPAADKAG
jgi:hypothetical protein